MKKIWGSLKAKHYIFVGLVIYQSSGWLSFVKMLFCRWLFFPKMLVSFVQIGSCGWFKYKEQ